MSQQEGFRISATCRLLVTEQAGPGNRDLRDVKACPRNGEPSPATSRYITVTFGDPEGVAASLEDLRLIRAAQQRSPMFVGLYAAGPPRRREGQIQGSRGAQG